MESYIIGDYRKAATHLHHAVRHAVRALVREGTPIEEFPIYDREVKLRLDSEGRKLLQSIIAARRKNSLEENEASKLLENTLAILGRMLKVRMPSLSSLTEACRGKLPIFLRERNGRVEVEHTTIKNQRSSHTV